MTPKLLRVPPNISGSGKATNVKFGRPIQRDSLSKSPDYLFSKRGIAMSRDSQHFRVPPNILGTGKATNVELVNKTGNIK